MSHVLFYATKTRVMIVWQDLHLKRQFLHVTISIYSGNCNTVCVHDNSLSYCVICIFKTNVNVYTCLEHTYDYHIVANKCTYPNNPNGRPIFNLKPLRKFSSFLYQSLMISQADSALMSYYTVSVSKIYHFIKTKGLT